MKSITWKPTRKIGMIIILCLICQQLIAVLGRWDSWPLTYYPMFSEKLSLNGFYGFRLVGLKSESNEKINLTLLHGKAAAYFLDPISKNQNDQDLRRYVLDVFSPQILTGIGTVILYRVDLNENNLELVWTKMLEAKL